MKIAYLRVSTENQKNEGTIDLQRQEIELFAEKNGYKIDRFFCDEGVSGTLQDRPGLAELFNFAEMNEVDEIIIWKLDRLARDLYIQEHIIRQLEKLNVKLISVKEKDLDSRDPMRRAFRQFIGIMSQLEKDFITMRLSAGRMNKARQNGYAGGSPAYGYKTKDKELIIDLGQAKVIRKIYYMRKRKNMSFGKIANELNDKGYTTARGGKWHGRTIKNIVENKAYKGVLSYKENMLKRSDLVIV